MMTHLQGDFALYGAFLAGQALFILKRAAMAIRSQKVMTTRRAYLLKNWDVLTIRTALEIPVFWVWRHFGATKWLGSLIGVAIPFEVPVTPMTAFMLGFLADSVLDWVATKVPFLKGEIPPANSTGGQP